MVLRALAARGTAGAVLRAALVLVVAACAVGVPVMLRSRFGLLGAIPLCAGFTGLLAVAIRIPRGLRREAVGNAVVAASVAALALVGVLPRLTGYRTLTVLSGSMRPTFAPGDVVVVTQERAADLRVGDVITYRVPVGARQVETHRVVRIVRRLPTPIVVTKGDANDHADPWTAELHGQTLWRYRFAVPWAGKIVIALRNPLFRKTALFFLPLLLAGIGLARIWGVQTVPRIVRARTR
jgi:signal peptidase